MDTSEDPRPGTTSDAGKTAGTKGGQIEPVRGRAPTPEKTARSDAAERYEVRDPFSEVVYHSKRIDEIATKAEQLGSNRFTAIDATGRRALVRQVDGQWTQGTLRSVEGAEKASPARDALDPGTASKHAQETTKRTPTVSQPAGHTPAAGTPQTKDDSQRFAEAERASRLAQLEEALNERYVLKRAPAISNQLVNATEYRFRGNTSRVAFTETTFKLATDINSPSVARSMVDVAEARGWKAVRVTGNEEFKRQVWIEAAVRGVKAVGYEPTKADQAALQRERTSRQINRVEPVPEATGSTQGPPAKASGRGGGRKAVLAAIEAILVAKKVPEAKREAIIAAATEKLAQRTRDGIVSKVRVYDMTAPSHRPVVAPTPEAPRTRERAGPAPTR